MKLNQNKVTLVIGLLVLVFVVGEFLLPQQLNWTVTLSAKDKNPYGAYGLHYVLNDLFPEQEIINNNLTVYETDSLEGYNYLILAQYFYPDDEDLNVLLQKTQEGADVLIASDDFGPTLLDTLGFSVNDRYFKEYNPVPGTEKEKNDSINITFTKGNLQGNFRYNLGTASSYFDSLSLKATVLAKNEYNEPVLAAVPWGKGNIILSTTPLAFTNFHLLNPKNHAFIEGAFSFVSTKPLIWTEYYQNGRMEPATPLRFVLKNDALRWAYYIGIGALCLFVLFRFKRSQRAIPVVLPPTNSSLQFAGTIGNLYYQQADHANLGKKKIIFFKEYIRSHYYISSFQFDEPSAKRVAAKAGKPETEVVALFKLMNNIEKAEAITEKDLLHLNNKIEKFYRV